MHSFQGVSRLYFQSTTKAMTPMCDTEWICDGHGQTTSIDRKKEKQGPLCALNKHSFCTCCARRRCWFWPWWQVGKHHSSPRNWNRRQTNTTRTVHGCFTSSLQSVAVLAASRLKRTWWNRLAWWCTLGGTAYQVGGFITAPTHFHWFHSGGGTYACRSAHAHTHAR